MGFGAAADVAVEAAVAVVAEDGYSSRHGSVWWVLLSLERQRLEEELTGVAADGAAGGVGSAILAVLQVSCTQCFFQHDEKRVA